MKIPSDIEKYIKQSITEKILKWLATTAGIVLLLCITNSSFDVANAEVKSFIYTALILIPFFAFKIPKLFFDRSWKGTIIRIFTDDELYLESKLFLKTPGWRQKNIIAYAEVQLDNKEETQIVKLYHGRYNDHSASRLKHYEVGNTIIHIRGASYFHVICENAVTCAICGNVNKKGNIKCAECGYSLNISEADN